MIRIGEANRYRLFIIDGVISLPVALAGFYFLPDVPEICRARYFTKHVGADVPC